MLQQVYRTAWCMNEQYATALISDGKYTYAQTWEWATCVPRCDMIGSWAHTTPLCPQMGILEWNCN